MPQILRTASGAPVVVPERSTLPIDVAFYDGGSSGPLVTPSSANWSLVDAEGAIVNERDEVALSVSAGLATIVLTNADLAVTGTAEVQRRVTVRATYTSASYGAGLTMTEEYVFRIAPLAGVPAGG